MKVPIVGGQYEGRSSNVAPEKCINWYYEKTKDGESLVNTPGDSVFSSPGFGEVRGGIEYNEFAYFVVGNTLYEIDSEGTATSRGTLNSSSGRVSMAHNGVRVGANQQIMIVDGTTGYIYNNATQSLSEISDTDMPAATVVIFLDGYFVFVQADSDRFWITGLYDGTSIDENDFATAEGDPDKLQAVISLNRDLLLMGRETCEIWYNSGDPDNTFQRYNGGFIQTGCAAKFSPAKFDNTVIFLTRNERGHGLVATLGEGYAPQYVSSPEMNYQVAQYTKIDDAFGYVYQEEGHEFYSLTFPTAKATWVYDASTKFWHQRAHTIDSVFPNRERYNCHVFAFGKHLMGDFANGKIYELDSSSGTANGERIPRERVTPIMSDEERRIRIAKFQLDIEEGTGDSNESDDKSVWLSYSKDGGHSFSTEIERSIGDSGEYKTRLIWRRLGHARNWIFRIRTWTPNRIILKGGYAKLYGER